MEVTNPTPNPSPKERGDVVFFISNKKDNITKLTKSARNIKEGFIFAIEFCKEFGFGMPIAFYLTPIPSQKERGAGVVEGRLYYYEDTEINSYLDNQMSQDELLENNWCDALVRNTEDLLALDTEIDAGSLFMVRGKYAYYISDYSIRIPLVDLEHQIINLS